MKSVIDELALTSPGLNESSNSPPISLDNPPKI
jgi:hypothetical protein